jgi:NitT/TauT family transport system permease protein
MPLILTYTNKVRQALKQPESVGVDVLLLLGVGGIIAALISMCHYMAAPRGQSVVISLAFSKLPLYTFYSLTRGFAAYFVSLVFTLVYGTIAAHNRVAEKILVPLLDILQSLPVLTLLPVVVTSMVALFPARWFGLELACVLVIFTAQAWNMTFSYYGSVRGIPQALREAAAIQRLSGWQIFRYLELPASTIGLVWNSMMSMAGGWFIISIEESFTLGDNNYELPGIGSYMNEALLHWNYPAMIAGVAAMIIMIILVDQFVWRPIVVWSQRFKLEDTAATDAPHSWVLAMFKYSLVLEMIRKGMQFWHQRAEDQRQAQIAAAPAAAVDPAAPPAKPADRAWLRAVITWLTILPLTAISIWGVYLLARLLLHLPIGDAPENKGWVAVLWSIFFSFNRVMASLLIGALWTVPVGVMIGLSAKWSNRLQPIIQIVASFPAPMIFPLLTVIFLAVRIPFTLAAVGLICLGTQWYILFNVIAGAMAIPSELREAGRVYHMTLWQRWSRLYVPAVFPYLLTGLITAAGGAWNATIVAELQTVPHHNSQTSTYMAYGIGSLIDLATGDSTHPANYPLLAASAVSIACFVVLFNRFVWKRVYRLVEERYSLNN